MKFKKGDRVIVCNSLVTDILDCLDNSEYSFYGDDGNIYTEHEAVIDHHITQVYTINPSFDEEVKKILSELWDNRANLSYSNLRYLKTLSEKYC